MAIENYLGSGIVSGNLGKGATNNKKSDNNSSENVGNIYMHPPYAVIVEPQNEGGNVTQGDKNYQATLNAYNAAKAKLINATDEAATLRNSWSSPPRVVLENGKLNLYGTDDFLKSDEAKQLTKVFESMKGNTYNNESLNKQIEAWNTALANMSKEYNNAIDQMNQVNNAILGTANMPNPHLLSFSEMQKVGNSAAVGKQQDARTTKNKIFVGYEWDDEGNMKEKWVEAKELFNEFDKLTSDQKRTKYHTLITQANNGDVGAYSKLMYLQGGSEGGPANVDYDKTVGDFFNTLGNNILMNLGGFAQGVFDWARFWNIGQITANISNYAEYFDQRDFWDLAAAVVAPGMYADRYDSRAEISRTINDAVKDYSAAVSWQNAFFSELTPGSTGAAAVTGDVTGKVLGMAYFLFASGVGQKVMSGDKYSQGIVSNAVSKANEALISTGKFVPYEVVMGRVKVKTDLLGAPLAGGGGIMGTAQNARKVYEAAASSGVYAVPTIIAKNFPNVAEAMGYAALIKNGGMAAVFSGKGTSLIETTISGGVQGAYSTSTQHTFATSFGNIIKDSDTYNAILNYTGTANTGALGAVTEKAMWKMVANGFRVAQTITPLVGISAMRNTDEYLQRLKAGEDVGDMAEFVLTNTAKDVVIGGALVGAGAAIGKFKAMAKAAKMSPADAASRTYAKDFSSQDGFYQPESPYYQKRLEPGNLNAKEVADLENTMSSIMTVNNEVFAGIPTPDGAFTSALPGTYVDSAARTFGVMSPRKAFKYSVEPTAGGAYIVTETTDLDTNTKVTTKEFRNSVEEAEKEIGEKSVPTTSPKTLSNNDQVADIKVAPLTVDGVAPETLPEGVSQIKFVPGTVYRTPDGLADEIADLVEKAGGSFEAVESAYQDAVEYASNNMDEPAPETPFLPERINSDFMLADEFRALIRAAAWAKAHNANAVPLRVPTSYSRVIKKFSMQDKFISKLVDKYNFPEIDIRDTIDNGKDSNRQGQRTNAIGSGALNLAAGSENPNVSLFPSADYGTSFVGKKPVLKDVLPKDAHDIIEAFGWFKVLNGVVGNDPTKELRKEINKVDNDVIDAYIEAVGLEEFGSKTALEDMISRTKTLIQALGASEPKETLSKTLAELWNHNLDYRLRMIDEDEWAMSDWKAASKRLVEKYRPRVKEAAEFFADVALKNIDMSTKGVNEDIKNISDIVDPAIAKASVELLKDKLANANSKLSSGIKMKAIESDIPGIYVTGGLIPYDMEGKAKMVHIPEGTKYIAPRDKFGRMYPDGESFAFDGSKGVTEKDGELYLNTSNGAEYIPTAAQYELSKYAIYDQGELSNYMSLKDWLKPVKGIKEAQGETEDYWKPSVFNMVAPGGPVNQNNKVLRAHGGKIPKDTLAERAKAAEKELEYLRNFFKNEDTYELGQIIDARRRAQNVLTGKNISNRSSEGTRLDQMRSFHDNFGAGGDELTDKEKKIASEMFDDIDETFEALEDKLVNETEYGTKTIGINRIIDEFEKTTNELAKKWGKVLGTSKKDMSPWFRLVDTWGRKGSHTLNLPEGVDYLWTFRGNPGNEAATDKTWMSTWEPGDHINSSSLDFNSLNTFTPYRYSEEYGQEEFVLAIGHPNGSGLFYFGDPLNFGDRVHRADGGAIVTPFNMGMTVVAIRSIGKNDAGKDVKLIIAIRDNADGTPYNGPIEGKGGGVEKITERVRADETAITPNNIVGMQYGVPYKYFANESDALEWAKEEGGRAVHKLDDNADILTRPPVTTEDLVENPLLLGAGDGYIPHIERFDELMSTLPTLMEEGEGAIDYLRGIVDIAREVNTVYTAVAANVNLDDIYSRYAKAIYDGEEVSLTPDEKKALEPITHMLDALGHYFDPSGKSLTQEFYLPTALAANKMVNIEKALLKGEEVDLEHPVDTGFNDILLDLQRIGDAGFWQKRTGDLFRDEDGNFTMARAGTLKDALTSYTVSALTRGKNSSAVAVNNEVAKSKYDRNRTQITEKQAYAGIKEADKIRGKTKSYRAAISKDADKIAELKEDYDESAVDQAMKAKNYSKDLGFVKSTNHAAQLLGYNQFLEMTPIQGSVLRYGTQGQVYRGTTSIRRKMEKINITGPMWVTRFGAKQRIGFGLEASEANTKKYGVFKAGEPAVNLGRIVSMNFDSDINALAYLYTLKGVIKAWSTGDGMDMVTAVNKYARENFPLLDDYEWSAAKLLKELARNYHASADPMAVDAMNVDSISKWIRDCTATCFNNAIMMTDISNLDDRTLEALDEAAAYIYVGSPLKRNKLINGMLKWESVAKLGGNVSPMLGNIVSEIFTRLPGYIGWKDTTRALKRALDTKEAARINNIISDLPSHYDSPEDDTMLQTAKKLFGTVTDKATGAALKPLTWSEKVKNLVYYAAGEINAERKGITDPAKKQLEAIRFVGEHAIAGGKGTAPGVAESSLGRTLFLFRTFTIRNFDDFIDFVEKASRGETGDNYWDAKYEKKYGKDNKDRSGRNKASFKLGAKAVGGRLMRSYIIWLTLLSYFGKSFIDLLGGDPTGITDGGRDRGLYDDEDTEEYEGMTDFDNFINSLPAGAIFGSLQDLYFAARRRGVDSKQFMAFDLWNDQKLNNDMSKHLPLGVAYNRFADMLNLLDRGYSFSSTGKKTYAAPETALDVVKGFLFGKSTTENSLAYGKYRYGTVNIWGDLSSGDWMDFAMNANPLKDITGSKAQFDTTRKDYTGVFDGSWNDIATMQLIIAQFKERQQTIIDEYNRDKYRYGGDYEGLTDAEKVAKAKEAREKKIDAYTEDVQRAVNAFTDAGNALSDKQITNLMYLFDFHEGEEDDEWNSSVARERYVEAGLPDYNAAAIQRTTKTEDGEKKDVTKNYLDRSLILQNAQQGFYGSSKKAANAVKDALSGFDSTYKAYKERVKALNDKYFAAREKNKKSAETKQLSKDLEKLQNEYLDKLYQQLTPVVEQYGTALIGTYDVADVLADYMSNMIPYSSIKKYGQTYSSGNDIVYGQLAEWLQKRWGRNAPTAPSDAEVTNGINDIKKLLDQGKTASAKSKARAILEKIGRGSLGARRYDVETLRDVAYD